MNNTARSKDALISLFRNEPLIEHEFSLPMIAESLWAGEIGSIYYGTGLCNKHCLTIGVPFDVLVMVLVAEKLRSALGLHGVVHHIADTHALCNFPGEKEKVTIKAGEFEEVMRRVINKFGLNHFTVVRSSTFDASPEYCAIMHKMDSSGDGEYARREITDMLWYQKSHNVVLKLGWAAKGFRIDERWYDEEFVRCFGKTLSFIYTKSGRTFTEKKVPYIATTEENRIFLRPGERVQEKFNLASGNTRKDVMVGAINYFAAICRLYEKLVYKLDKGPVPQRVQQIINHIFE